MYTDKNGYVIGIDESESVKIEDVYYVTGVGKDGGVYSDSYLARRYLWQTVPSRSSS